MPDFVRFDPVGQQITKNKKLMPSFSMAYTLYFFMGVQVGVEIAYKNDIGNFLKRLYWHNSQKLETLENGELILQFKCGINNELVGCICQLHENLKVLSPIILQNLVASKLKSTFNQYK